MSFALVSTWLKRSAQPQHPNYYPLQLAFAGSVGYLSVALFTRIAPLKGMAVAALATAISHAAAPLFVEFFDPYKNIPLIPLTAQFLQLSFSILSAATICNLAGQRLSLKEVHQLAIAFLATSFLARIALETIPQKIIA